MENSGMWSIKSCKPRQILHTRVQGYQIKYRQDSDNYLQGTGLAQDINMVMIQNAQNTVSLVYIMGAGHSGSTLLDMLIGAHPAAFSMGEISNLDRFIELDSPCTCGVPVRRCDFWSTILCKLAESVGCSVAQLPFLFPTDIRQRKGTSLYQKTQRYLSIPMALALFPHPVTPGLIMRIAPAVYERVHNAHVLYDLIREVSGKTILVDSSKNPRRMKLLYLLRPETTRAIFLTRDGRGVVNSFMKRVGFSAEQAARNWRQDMRYGIITLKTMRKGHHLHIRYEELCRKPGETLNKVCDFIGLDFDPGMLSFRSGTYHNIGGNRMRFGQENSIIENTRWRKELKAQDLFTFERIAGDLNRRLLGEYFVPYEPEH